MQNWGGVWYKRDVGLLGVEMVGGRAKRSDVTLMEEVVADINCWRRKKKKLVEERERS